MTEKDFRKLVTDLEILNTEKQELHCRFDRLQEKLAKHQDDYFRIVSVKKSGSWAKGTLLNDVDKIDIMVGIELNKPNSFVLDNYYVLNAIENIIIAEYPSITKLSNIDRNLQFNTISFKENDFTIYLQIRYLNDFFQITDEEKRINFVEIANKDYTYFRNTIKIIKYYRDEQKINISGYILEIMLYYSLNEYFKDNRYEDYLNGFIKTIDELIKGNKIEVSKDIYQKLNVDSNTNVKKTYMVLDVANPNNNLTDNINDLSIGEYRKLKKVLSKLIDNKNSLSNNSNATIVLNINPLPIKDTNEFSWSYQIEGSNYNNTGGAYQNSEDQLLLAMYKGLYKGLRAIVDNNLNRKNIEVICKKQNILKLTTNVSQENLSRIKNIEAYIENNGLIIKYR